MRLPSREERGQWVLQHPLVATLIAAVFLGALMSVLQLRRHGDANPLLVVGVSLLAATILAALMVWTTRRSARSRRPRDEWWKD